MGIRHVSQRILDDIEQVRTRHDLSGRDIGLAMWGLRLGEAPAAPFDVPGPERDAVLRFMWLQLVRLPAQMSTGLVTSLLRLEMLMEGAESLEAVSEDLRQLAHLGHDFIGGDRLPASWYHSANALRDVLRRSDHDLLLLVARPLADLDHTRETRVTALEAHASDEVRAYLDRGDPRLTVAAEPGRDRAELGLHLAWWGAVDEGLAAIRTAVDEGVPAWIGARMRARTLHAAGRYEEAIPVFEAALELRPAADTAHDLALCLAELGHLDEAEAAYGQAAELAPDWVSPLWNRGVLRMERLGNLDGARADTEAAIALDPRNPALRRNLALVDIESGDDDAAVAHLSEALRLAPNTAQTLIERARVHTRRERHEAALADLRRARSVEDTPLAQLLEARVRRDLGDLAGAAVAFEAVLSAHRHADIAAEAATVEAALGHRERAIAHGIAALTMARDRAPFVDEVEALLADLDHAGPRTWPMPEASDHARSEAARERDPQAYASLDQAMAEADAHQASGDLVAARSVLLRWLHTHQAPEAWLSVGMASYQLGEPEAAVAAFEQALELDPDRVMPRVAKAEVLGSTGRFPAAVAAWGELCVRCPDVADVWRRRGSALLDAGRPAEALAAFDRALELAPADGDALYNRAVALGDLERDDEALAAYDAMLALHPGAADALLNRSSHRANAGDVAGAIADMNALVRQEPGLAKAWSRRGALRQIAGDGCGALIDGLVGFELFDPNHPLKAHAAGVVRAAYAAFDSTIHGLPDRRELLFAAETLVDHLPWGVEDRVRAVFDDLAGALGHTATFWAVRAEIGELLALPVEECAAWRDQALALDPDDGYARFTTAEAILRSSPDLTSSREALALLAGAIADSDPVADADWRLRAHLRLGRLHLDFGAFGAAIEVLEAGLALDEASEERARTAAHVAFLLGYALSATGRAHDAVAAYTRGLELDPHKANLWFNRACEHARLSPSAPDHRDLALADLAEAMERDPEAGSQALDDAYFEPLWGDHAFRALVALRPAAI